MQVFTESLETLKDNKEKQSQKHAERMSELDAREALLIKRESDVSRKEAQVAKGNSEIETKLRGIWEREMNSRNCRRQIYIDEEIKKWKRKASVIGSSCLVLLIVVAVWLIYAQVVESSGAPSTLDILLENKILSIIFTILVGVLNLFTIQYWYNCSKNPAYENNKRQLLNSHMPKDLEVISYEEYVK